MGKIEILKKSLWSLDDIKIFCGCGSTKASQIMKAAKQISISRFLPSKAKRDNVFLVLGLDFQEELKKIKLINSEEN